MIFLSERAIVSSICLCINQPVSSYSVDFLPLHNLFFGISRIMLWFYSAADFWWFEIRAESFLFLLHSVPIGGIPLLGKPFPLMNMSSVDHLSTAHPLTTYTSFKGKHQFLLLLRIFFFISKIKLKRTVNGIFSAICWEIFELKPELDGNIYAQSHAFAARTISLPWTIFLL